MSGRMRAEDVTAGQVLLVNGRRQQVVAVERSTQVEIWFDGDGVGCPDLTVNFDFEFVVESAEPLAAIKIALDGSVTPLQIPRDKVRESLYEAIGCTMVDIVQLDSQITMWIDDEGFYNSDVNDLATLYAAFHGFRHQDYYGAVVLTGGVDKDGDTLGLSARQRTEVANMSRVKELAGFSSLEMSVWWGRPGLGV